MVDSVDCMTMQLTLDAIALGIQITNALDITSDINIYSDIVALDPNFCNEISTIFNWQDSSSGVRFFPSHRMPHGFVMHYALV